MTPEQWEHIQALFEAALEQPPAERSAFLQDACAGNPDLRREVESLLRAAAETGPVDALERDLVAPLAGSLYTDPMEGRRVGPYQVLRRLGEGGMGAVFLAERADGAFEQQVALKLVRQGLASEALRQRFLTERQILARLQHPHIAQLLDGGVTPEGQPYFAMEFVDGQPVGDYADARQLSITERLRLFKAVCQAVRYAHQNLVVHRDLKPSNILVTEDGTVKLLDFGIAKLLEDGDADAVTQTGLRVMTPEYAAPEQVRGEPVTTATDVYSLGVVLYELLTGHRPYQVKALSPSEVERVICEAEPPRPSTAVRQTIEVRLSGGGTRTLTPEAISRVRSTQPERLQRRLVGDLDMIVLKALAKEPPRRYANADALLEDINRHLAGLPVEAQGNTVGYRTRKFVQRHRWGVAVAAAFVLLLTATAVAMTLQQAATARERDRARAEAEKAQAVTQFMIDVFEVSDPASVPGDSVTARQLLDESAARIETELAGQPAVQAAMMQALGQVYQNLSLYDQARPLLERSVELARQAHGSAHPDLAGSLNALGLLHHAEGAYPAAESLYAEALVMRRALLGPDDPAVAEVLNNLGGAKLNQAEYAAADSLLHMALAVYRQHYPDDHADIARTIDNLAQVQLEQGGYDEAAALHREALAMRRHLLGNEHFDVATSTHNLAVALYYAGQYDEAETLYREALRIFRRVGGERHSRAIVNMGMLARLMIDKGDLEAAVPVEAEAIALAREVLGNNHPDLATMLDDQAILFERLGRFEEAEQTYREVLAMRYALLGDEHTYIAFSLNNLAGVLRRLQRADEALVHYRDAVARLERGFGRDHSYVAAVRKNMATVLHQTGAIDEAEQHFREALRVYELDEGAPEHVVTTKTRLGRLLVEQGKAAEAEPLLGAAVQQGETVFGPVRPEVIEAQIWLAAALRAQARRGEADSLEAVAVTSIGNLQGDAREQLQIALEKVQAEY